MQYLLSTLQTCLLLFLLGGCNANGGNASVPKDSPVIDSQNMKPSTAETIATEKMIRANPLDSIRVLVREMAAIKKWSSTTVENLEESVEGGEATFYFLNGHLQKIRANRFGETYQQLTDYYVPDGKLLFVLDTTYKYNRPIYYDSISMRESNDTEVFDFRKSTVLIDSCFFTNGKLIQRATRQQGNKSSDTEYLHRSEKDLLQELKRLMDLKR